MKKDSGIAVLHNGLLIPEEVRDQLAKRDWTKPADKPNWNPDQATTNELKDHRFSGFRVNNFTNDMELWCLGNMEDKVRLRDLAKNPGLMAEMHEKVFATAGTVLEIPKNAIQPPPRQFRRTKRKR